MPFPQPSHVLVVRILGDLIVSIVVADKFQRYIQQALNCLLLADQLEVGVEADMLDISRIVVGLSMPETALT